MCEEAPHTLADRGHGGEHLWVAGEAIGNGAGALSALLRPQPLGLLARLHSSACTPFSCARQHMPVPFILTCSSGPSSLVCLYSRSPSARDRFRLPFTRPSATKPPACQVGGCAGGKFQVGPVDRAVQRLGDALVQVGRHPGPAAAARRYLPTSRTDSGSSAHSHEAHPWHLPTCMILTR